VAPSAAELGGSVQPDCQFATESICTARGLCGASGRLVSGMGLPPYPSFPSVPQLPFQPSLALRLTAQRPLPPLTPPAQPTDSSGRATTGPASTPSAAPQLQRCLALECSTTVSRSHEVADQLDPGAVRAHVQHDGESVESVKGVRGVS